MSMPGFNILNTFQARSFREMTVLLNDPFVLKERKSSPNPPGLIINLMMLQ